MKIKLDNRIAEICGIHAGDGYLRNDGKRRELDISGSFEEKEYYDKHMIPLFNKVFSVQIKGRFFQARGTYGFVIRNSNFEIIEFIHTLGFPYGNKTAIVKVPNFILENKTLEKSFLRGYFDTDGSLSFARRKSGSYIRFKKTRNYYPRIIFSTVSKNLAEDLKKILNDLDFNFVFYIYKPKNERENLKYSFNINGLKNLKKWLSLIGINNPIKYSRFLIWKKYGFCPVKTTYQQRLKIINGSLDPNMFYKGPMR